MVSDQEITIIANPTPTRDASGRFRTAFKSTTFSTGPDSKFISERRSNVKSDLIEITHDKLENILLKHEKKRSTRKEWATPLGLSITMWLAHLTGTFNDKLGVAKTEWAAIFFLGAIVSTVWFVVSIFRVIAYWKKSDIDYLIRKIKNQDDSD